MSVRALIFSFVASAIASDATSFAVCPLLGPELDLGMQTGNSTNGPLYPNSTSFSIALFSANEPGNSLLYEYHHTSPSLGQSVDAESIYRVGDLSQVFTVVALLKEVGDSIWHEPVTKYVPELKGNGADSVDLVDWDEVRVGELASHMAGLGRDPVGLNDITTMNLPLEKYGFPDLRNGTVPTCSQRESCTRAALEFFQYIKERSPVFLPSSIPIYSNAAFQILGYVLESVTGKSFENILSEAITEPLSMNGTTSTASKSSYAVIPGNETSSGWTADLGDANPALGLYSSVYDLAKFGNSLLTSTILSPAITRRWLKPVSPTSNVVNSVGMPWEIFDSGRLLTGHTVDIYLKLGYSGVYSSYMGLVPSYGVGFAILAAGDEKAPDLNAHADIIAANVLPAIIKSAALQAATDFMGSYTSASNGSNSSLVIEVDGEPGLSVTELISQGTDTRAAYTEILGLEPGALSIRLFPTNLKSEAKDGEPGTFVFRAAFQDKNDLADGGTPTCISWMNIDSPTYGGSALDRFVLKVNKDGSAVGIEVPALQLKLERDA